MFGIIDYIKIGAGIAAGILLYGVYATVIHDPAIRREEAAKCTAEKEQMVSRAQYDAMAAVADRERQLRDAATQAATEAKKRAESLASMQQQQAETIAALTAEAAAAGNLSSPTEDDLKWYSAHH